MTLDHSPTVEPADAPASDLSAPDVLGPAQLGPLTLRNRVIKAATFEGMTPEGLVTDELIEFHRRVAAGGVGHDDRSPTWPSLPEGRTHRQSIHLRDEAAAGSAPAGRRRPRRGGGGGRPGRPRRPRGQPDLEPPGRPVAVAARSTCSATA